MNSRMVLRKFASRALNYTARIMMANGFGSFDLWRSPNCWAQQTVIVSPGNNLQALVNQYPASTTFSFTPGIYYFQAIVPQSHDSFVGQPGAILSGAALLTTFRQSGSSWTSQVHVTQAASYPGHCGPNPACIYPEDLFFNSVPKTRVSSLSAAGPGFWIDINSQNVVCNANQFTANEIAGIMIEISNTVTVSNNSIWNDASNPDGTGIWWGAGIMISTSSNVSVYFNTVSNSMNGIAGILASRGYAPNGQLYSLQNVNVNSNWITQSTGIAAGIALEGSGFDNSVYTSWNNHFQYNTFTLANPSGDYICWLNEPMTFSAWGSVLSDS